MKHTPGPWKIEESQQIINGHNHTLFQISSKHGSDREWTGTGVAACMVPDEDNTIDVIGMVKANAKLIAASPDLLEACEEAFDAIIHDRGYKKAVDMLLDAIDKANRG